MSGFGDDDPTRQVPRDSRMECGVCWTVYDPAIGDDVWQIPAGTAFADLPEDWRCPNCDAPRAKFLILGTGDGGGRA